MIRCKCIVNCKCEGPDLPKEKVQEIANVLQCPVDEIRAIEFIGDEVVVERTFTPVAILKVTQLASFKKELL